MKAVRFIMKSGNTILHYFDNGKVGYAFTGIYDNVNYDDVYNQSQEEFDKSILETIELNKENNAVESIEIY